MTASTPTRTSNTHPLRIDTVLPAPGMGRIGLTFCPGKTQLSAMSGHWNRCLETDLDTIRDWNAAAVVTLIEDHEFDALQVRDLGEEVQRRHMAWYHLPIPDVSVPGADFEAAWMQAGSELRARLRQGADIIVHCKGGLGRAGTIAARLLVELGVADPEAAIQRVRAVRPGAIETCKQESHVRAIRPAPPAIPSTSAEAICDRAAGALLGLAIGDAIGTTLEFTRRDSRARLIDIVGGGPFGLKPGEWTDDTAMALALADSLAECGRLDEADLMRRFTAWHDDGVYSCTGTCFDIGITTRAALSRFQLSGNPVAGDANPSTAGNGSLMRLAPVAIRFWNDPAKLVDAAARQSRTTHAAPEAVDACVAFARMLADAIAGRSLAEILGDPGIQLPGVIGEIVAGSWRTKPRAMIASSGYVAHSLEAALWSVGRSAGYRESVLTAANLGDDADTTAAIAGQLAGAAWGASGIPVQWRERVAWSNRIAQMAERLLAV
ncbi:ADP-ribosylglycohydrolase family protein [Parapedomonas caeni]